MPRNYRFDVGCATPPEGPCREPGGNATAIQFDHKIVPTKTRGDVAEQSIRGGSRWGSYKLSAFSEPTIAMVNVYCFGSAFISLVACDFAIAADVATFGLSEVNSGILPGGLLSKVFTMTMNCRKSTYHAMNGRPFDGRTAAEIRLKTYTVPGERLSIRSSISRTIS